MFIQREDFVQRMAKDVIAARNSIILLSYVNRTVTITCKTSKMQERGVNLLDKTFNKMCRNDGY